MLAPDSATIASPRLQSRSRRLALMLVDVAACTLAVAAATTANAGPAGAPATAPSTSAKVQAEALYEQGIALADQGRWEEALAKFSEARSLYAGSWKLTSWSAIALEKTGRYDEALEMFEVLLREFTHQLPPRVKADAQGKVNQMRRRVGILEVDGAEPGASVTIDRRPRGTYPLPGPLRLTTGTHVVVVYLQGFEPFVQIIEIVPGSVARVEALLRPLNATGRLHVAEKGGQVLEIAIDGSAVGKTPWEGALAPGEHVVVLRGKGNLGTPPVRVTVEVNRTVPLTLKAEELGAALRVEPVPGTASVAIDGVTVGPGAWEGRVRVGTHNVEVAAPGFRSSGRLLTIGDQQREVVRVTLDRNKPPRMSRFLVETATSMVLVPTFGGDVAGACTGACAEGAGVGGSMVLHAGYELGMGLGFGATVGYLAATQTISSRDTTVKPMGLPADEVTANDAITLRGVMMGVWSGFTFDTAFPIHLRLAAGALFGSLSDTRTGTLVVQGSSIGSVGERHAASFVYVTPEARVGLPLNRHAELTAGLAVPILVGVSRPRWNDAHRINAAKDGYATFASNILVASAIATFVPGIGARYDF